ncbi:MAG: hypothetical protein IJF32_03505 [Oscillospiraceae bacterium]|nr:hypothetical protein [Oscillospiraceae bacterium]
MVTNEKTKKKPLIMGVILLCLISVATLFVVNSQRKLKYYEEAISLFNQNQYEQAAEIFEKIGYYKDSSDFEDKCRIKMGETYLASSDYEKAKVEFTKINNSNRSKQLINKSKYAEAEMLFNDGNYDRAIELFSELGGYSDSINYVERCGIALKYKKFDYSGNGNEHLDFYDYYGYGDKIENYIEAESYLSFAYGKWYDANDQEISISPTQFNGKAYGVYALANRSALIYIYENADEVYELYGYHDYIVGERLEVSPYREHEKTINYGSFSTMEYEQEKEKIPNYADRVIVDKTVAKAKERLSYGYSGTERLYHSCTVNSSSVSYDWNTRTYTCNVSITYSSNVFDFWGTSSNTYDVVATYTDTGSELVATSFDIF